MAKAETSQMFQMLMTLIVVGMILLLGSQLIGNILQRSTQIDYIKFRRALVNTVEAVGSDYNARQKVELTVPRGSTELCFVDMNEVGTTGNPLIDSYWRDTRYRDQDDKSMVRNVFLVGDDIFLSFRVEKLSIDNYNRYVCIDVRRSNVEFWAEGTRNSVSIEPVV